GNIQLSWTAVVGAPSAVVKRSLAPGGPYTPIANVASATAYLDSAVTSGTNYYYVVSAVGINEGPNSSEASAVPSPLPPPPPPVENILLKGCGATGLEAFVFLALLRAPARRRAPAHG